MKRNKKSSSRAVSDSGSENTVSLEQEAYIERLGVDRSLIEELTVRTLEQLQQAHITTIPFETLSITGDPHGGWDGEEISLCIPDIYSKIVTDRRGGFCYELNGLFGWLLADLGFDVRRVSARIKSGDAFGPPADHLTLIVDLDEQYLVDVGFGMPKLRRPLALNGSSHVDDAGISWRITGSERADADHTVEYRPPDSAEWATRCIFRDIPRTMDYFQATCEYFERAPDSHFTGDPVVTIATERGHSKLTPTTVTRSLRDELTEQTIDKTDWYDMLEEEFGLSFPPEASADDTGDSHGSAKR